MSEISNKPFDALGCENCAVTIPGYLLGEISAQEKRCRQHLQKCAQCREQMWQMQQLIDNLNQAEVELPNDLTANILAAIPKRQWTNRKFVASQRSWLGAAVAVLLSFAVLWLNYWRQPPLSLPPGKESFPDNKHRSARIIAASLRWLATNQENDGSWSAEKWGGEKKYTIALTGLAVLVLLENHGDAGVRARGIDYLLNQQSPQGLFGSSENGDLYNHGIATLALLKASSQSRSRAKALTKPITAAISYICSQQNACGGWQHSLADQSEVSLSLWQLQALLEAASQGHRHLDVPISVGLAWLQRTVLDLEIGLGTSAIAGSLLCHGNRIDHHNRREVLEHLKNRSSSRLPVWDYYHCFFISTMLRRIDADNNHNRISLKQQLLRNYIARGPYQGSWAPIDHWSKAGGRIYATVFAIRTLKSF